MTNWQTGDVITAEKLNAITIPITVEFDTTIHDDPESGPYILSTSILYDDLVNFYLDGRKIIIHLPDLGSEGSGVGFYESYTNIGWYNPPYGDDPARLHTANSSYYTLLKDETTGLISVCID